MHGHDTRILTERPLPQDGRDRTHGAARAPRTVTVNRAESPLGWLHARGHISDRQFDAGEKLRMDWERAQFSPSITMRWDAAPLGSSRRAASSGLDASERQMAAKQRFEAAVAAIGADLSDIAWRVICAGEGVPTAEKSMGWPVRSGKIVLRIALNRLADFYRLPG